MKVLLPIIWHDLTHCIARAFEEEGHEVRVVDWRNVRRKRQSAEDLCIRSAQEFKPDLAFCQFQAPDVITSRFPKVLSKLGCFAVQWAGDVRHPLPDHYVRMASHFDVTSFSNMTDVELIRATGMRSEFLQIGYDERIYEPGDEERSGVVFIGNNYSGYKFAESEGRRDMVKAMCEAFPDDFKVYGMSWEGIATEKNLGGYVREPGDADILRSASVAIGWDHFHRPWFASDRLLRATACGCATINQWYEGIKEEHPHVAAAKSIEHMVALTRLALSNSEEAKAVGQLSAAHTLANHRWNNRVKQVEQWMK